MIDVDEPQIFEPVVFLKRENISIGRGSRIDSFVKLEGGEGLIIGIHVHIASFAHVGIGGGKTWIDDYAMICSGAKIISGSNQDDAISFSSSAPSSMQRIVRSFVHLKKYSAIATGGIVLPGVTLDEGAILAAGSVATKNIPPWEIWAGVPAKFLRKRHIRDEYRRWLRL